MLKLLAVLRRHGWIIVQSVVTIALAAGFFAARAPTPPYVATASLVYDVRSLASDPNAPDPTFGLADPFLRRQALVLRGSEFLDLVTKQLPGETPDSLRRSVRVAIDRQNSLIVLQSSGPNPRRAILLVQAMATTFEGSKFNDITRSLRERASELGDQVRSLETRLNNINNRLLAGKASGADTTLLEAQQTTALGEYTSLFASQQRMLNQIAVQRRPMVTLDAGTVTRGAKPSPVRRGVLGAVVGFVLGAGLVTLRALLDGRLRSTDQVEDLAGLPVLGELPRLVRPTPRGRTNRRRRRAVQRALVVVHQPNGSGAEAFRKLRTAVLFQRADNRLATIAITGPDSGGDKSAVAANLAATFAGSGLRTILVSADFRRSELASWFAVGDRPGLHELLDAWSEHQHHKRFSEPFDLVDGATMTATPRASSLLGLDDAGDTAGDSDGDLVGSYLLRSPSIARLRLLPACRPPGVTAERLASPDAASLVAKLASMADLVVFDCASTSTADAGVVAALCDATLVVVPRNKSDATSLLRSIKQLRLVGTNIIGLVLTRCDAEPEPASAVVAAQSRHPASTSMTRAYPAKPDPSEMHAERTPAMSQTPGDGR